MLACQRYIWAMDEKDIIERLGSPDKIVRLKDRLLSHEWRCSSCGFTVEDTIPIPVPAPCPKCNGIAFEAVERPPQ
jgi:predicted Zn-ribbon and HTH transcriptional regulator